MQNFQGLLSKLKQSFICSYTIGMTTLSKITYCIVKMSQHHSSLLPESLKLGNLSLDWTF